MPRTLRVSGAVVSLLIGSVLATPTAQAPAVREGYADVPGARIFYMDTGGSGIPVVLLHANTGSSRIWEYQVPPFVASGFRVIAYDRRGFGRTTLDPAGVQPGAGADDLQGLLQHLRIDRFHLVGTAGGAFIALDYALSYPQRLRSLVLANTIGGVQDEDYLEMGRRMRPPQFTAMPPDIRELGPSYRAANPEGAERWKALERISRPDGPAAPAQTMRNRITFASLETLRMPTLLLTGDADMFAPPAILRLFAARIKHAQSIVIPEAGHSSYWEQPQLFNRAVLQFLRKH